MIAALVPLLLAAAQPGAPPPAREAKPCLPASVEEIAAAPGRFLGRCVVVSGVAGRALLFDDIEGYYRFGRIGQESQRSHVGLAGIDGPGGRPHDDPVFLRVVGRVASCQEIRDVLNEAGRRDLLPPYCQFGLSPLILVDRHEADPERRYERLVGEANRRLHGTLDHAPADWELLPRLREAAETFRRAIAAGDMAALIAMHGLEEASDPELLDYLLKRPDSPFAELRDGTVRQIAILLRTDPALEAQARRDGLAFLCFCRTADCTGLWPISFYDAYQGRADRPYACTFHNPGGRGLLSTSVVPGLLPEPATSAFRRPGDSSRH